MYRKIFLILFFITLTSVLRAQTTNLVNNPSFENGSGTDPDGWTADKNGGATLSWSKTFAHSGTSSICVNNIQERSTTGSNWISDFIDVEPGTAYDCSYWVYITKEYTKASGSTQGQYVEVLMYDANGEPKGSWDIHNTTETPNQWCFYNKKIIFDSSTVKIKIKTYFAAWQLPYTGSIYLDDFEIKKCTPTIKLALLAPMDNEVLPAKGKYDIRWYSENIPLINLIFECLGDYGVKNIPNINGALGTYKWIIPDTIGNYNVNIKDQIRDFGVFKVVKIARPVLNVVFPSGGENLNGGSVQTLSWNNTAMNTVKLEYSTNYGTVWIKIADSVKSQNGTYDWKVPSLFSAQCLIRVSDAVYETGTTSVSNLFSINNSQSSDNLVLNPSFEIGSGSKPDNWSMQNPENVTMIWADTLGNSGKRSIGLGYMKNPSSWFAGWISNYFNVVPGVEYLIKFWTYAIKLPEAGKEFTLMIEYYDSNGNYMGGMGNPGNLVLNQWILNIQSYTTPQNAAKAVICVVINPINKVFGGFSFFDDFLVCPKTSLPKLRLITPVGGEKLAVGSRFDIKWESQNISKVNIYYNPKSGTPGSSYQEIARGLSANTGSYSWTVPDSVTTTCNFMIRDTDNPLISSELGENNWVTIYRASSINLTAPAGGETWLSGSVQKIKWTSNSVNRVKLEYSIDNGASWKLIVDSVNAVTQEYPWTVPASPSSQCKIKVSSIDASVFSINQNPFTIEKIIVSAINIVSPKGGEIWQTGTVQQILWTSANISDVNVDFSSDNGGTWERIASNLKGADGKYFWTINKSESQKCQIRLTDASNPLVYSKSGGNFILYSQPVNITLSYTMGAADVSKASSFRMIGVPGLTNYPVSQILKGTHKNDWQVFYDNGDSLNYMIAYDGSAAFNLRPGAGFWVISKNPVIVGGITASAAVNDGACYNISLNKGWNIISNPFEKSISWTQVQSLNVINESLWDFNGSFTASASLDPYKGYYFFNAGNLAGLKIPYVYSTNMSQVHLAKDISKEIKLKLYAGGQEKSDVIIGFSNYSRSGKDTCDVYKPVSDFESERIVIRNEELKGNYKFLYSDFRTECDTQSYDLRIRLVPNESYVLGCDGKLDNETGVLLIDERLGNLYDMTEMGEARLKSAFEENEFSLLIGKKSILNEIKEKSAKPLNFTLENNFPNPFNPATVIAYSITDPGEVVLKVYDIQGKEIETLVNEYQNAGRYSVRFSVKDKEISSGIYIYTLQSGEKKLSGKMLLLK